jgi:hypothetical protein
MRKHALHGFKGTRSMSRIHAITCVVAAGACVVPAPRAVAQTATANSATESAKVAFAERVAVRALRFAEHDANGLAASRSDFTNSAWTSFLKQFDGFLDATGAPQFSSLFTPAGPAVVVWGERRNRSCQDSG